MLDSNEATGFSSDGRHTTFLQSDGSRVRVRNILPRENLWTDALAIGMIALVATFHTYVDRPIPSGAVLFLCLWIVAISVRIRRLLGMELFAAIATSQLMLPWSEASLLAAGFLAIYAALLAFRWRSRALWEPFAALMLLALAIFAWKLGVTFLVPFLLFLASAVTGFTGVFSIYGDALTFQKRGDSIREYG